MEDLSIFSGISPEEQQAMHKCFHSREAFFRPDEIIMTYTQSPKAIGILLEGHARLYYNDADGNQSVIEELFQNHVFGEMFLLPSGIEDYFVRAGSQCRVLFIDYKHVVKRCQRACSHHSQLVSNLFQLTAQKSQQQANRIRILTQPSTRLKLLTYFGILCRHEKDGGCMLPMSYSALAEYLCLDRSSMMRELKKLCEEGVLEKSGRSIHLLNKK